MNNRIEHRYRLYVWKERLNKYVLCVEFNTLEKIKEFYSVAKKDKDMPYYARRGWVKKSILKGANLNKYYIRHIETKIEKIVLKDEVLKEYEM